MKLLILLTFITTACLGKDTLKASIVHRDTVYYIDTIYQTDTVLVKKELIKQSEYFQLYEKLLEQKQQHYDSTLNNLNWVAGILALLFTIIIGAGAMLGFNEFRQIRRELKEQLESKKNEIESDLEDKLTNESKKVASKLLTDMYEEDLTELKERTTNLENMAKEISDSYVIQHGKEKPKLTDLKDKPKTTKNPFQTN